MKSRRKRLFYPLACVYEWGLEPFLRSIKKSVSDMVEQRGLEPCLDMCCGTGAQCSLLADRDQRAVGLDLDFRMLQHAKARHPQIPFLCADAAWTSLRPRSFRSIILSFALHEKNPETRQLMLQEIRRLLDEDGKLILVDFEKPWNRKACWGGCLTTVIERMAGEDHYRNAQQFLHQGGLTGFASQNGLIILERHSYALSHTRLFLCRFP